MPKFNFQIILRALARSSAFDAGAAAANIGSPANSPLARRNSLGTTLQKNESTWRKIVTLTTLKGRTSKNWAVAIVAIFLTISTAHAYVLDTLIGSSLLANSGDATELAAMKSLSGNTSLTLLSKVDINLSNTPGLNPGTLDQFYIDVAPQKPLFFLLKFGIGNTNSIADHFFFKNIGDLDKLVFSDAQVNFLTGGGNCATKGSPGSCNIGRLSHYDIFAGTAAGGVVPEPATVLLFSLGALALAAARRRSKM